MARHAVRVTILVVALAVVGVAPAAASEPGLVAQWNFDEGAGQVVHDSGPFSLDAVLGLTRGADAADPLRVAGATGGALHFDGRSSVRLPDTDRLAPQHLVVETVARADHSPGAYRYLISRGGSGCLAASYGLYTARTGGLAFYVFDGSRYILSATARRSDVWDGSWHTLKGIFDGATLRLFVDGREVGDPMAGPPRIDYAIPHSDALLGQYAGDCALGFAGDIDSLRVFSDPESPAIAPASPPLPPLPAAEPGTTLPAGTPKTPAATVPTTGGKPAPPSSQAKRGCTVRLSRRTIVAGRRTIIRARLTNAPRRAKLRVSAKRTSAHKALATARLSRAGSARLVLRAPRSGRVTVRVVGHSACAPAQLRVRK